jgi:hypothetical protein
MAKPRTKAERAAKEEMERLAKAVLDRRDFAAVTDPSRFIPPAVRDLARSIKPLSEQIADALAARRRGPVKDEDEAAFAEVREVKSHNKLDDRAACFHVAGLRGWNKENFYRRYLRRAK